MLLGFLFAQYFAPYKGEPLRLIFKSFQKQCFYTGFLRKPREVEGDVLNDDYSIAPTIHRLMVVHVFIMFLMVANTVPGGS
jgi:hypothetical protein